MSGREEEVLAFFEDLRLTEDGFVLAGVAYDAPLGRSRKATSPIDLLEGCIYAGLHTHDRRRRGDASPSGRSEAAGFANGLASSVVNDVAWQHGWTVERCVADAFVVCTKGLMIWAERNDVRPLIPNEPMVPGSNVALRVPRCWRSLNFGFLTVCSSSHGMEETAVDPKVRLYWHISDSGAAPLLRALTHALDALGLEYTFKTANLPAEYCRADAAVLYLPRRALAPALPSIRGAYAEIAAYLRPETSVFARRIAAGLAIAEDGFGEVSFGQHRARQLAECLMAIPRATDTDERVRQALAAMGESWTRSHLARATSRDFGELAGMAFEI